MRIPMIQALAVCIGLFAASPADARREYHKVNSPGPVKYCCSECIKRNGDGICTDYSQCETGTMGLGYCPNLVINTPISPVKPRLPAAIVRETAPQPAPASLDGSKGN